MKLIFLVLLLASCNGAGVYDAGTDAGIMDAGRLDAGSMVDECCACIEDCWRDYMGVCVEVLPEGWHPDLGACGRNHCPEVCQGFYP